MVDNMELDLRERLKAYIENVEQFIEKIKGKTLDKDVEKILDLARAYLSDAKYYFINGDYFTSLACIAYAEGLLDSIRVQGKLPGIEWKPISELLRRPRVLVAGSFEFLHPGHLWLLRKAWELGDVYVVISRDENFERFKGRKPVLSQDDRLAIVESLRYTTKALIGDRDDFLKPILDIKPDIVLLGPDQWIDPETLREKLAERGLRVEVVKLEKRYGEYSSSNIYNSLKRVICSNS